MIEFRRAEYQPDPTPCVYETNSYTKRDDDMLVDTLRTETGLLNVFGALGIDSAQPDTTLTMSCC